MRSLKPSVGDFVLGSWSVCDLLVHQVGWDHTSVDAVAEVLAGGILGFCARQDSDWRIDNGLHIEWYERRNPQELFADEEASWRESLRRPKSVPPAKWERDRGIRNWGWGSHRPADHAQDDGEEKHLAQLKAHFFRSGDRSAGKGAQG